MLSGELENTNIRTISKCLFGKKGTQQVTDVCTSCKHSLERKKLLLEVSWGELQPTRAGGACHAACLPALWSASCWLWLCFHCRTNQFNFLDCNPLPHPAVCFFRVNFLPFQWSQSAYHMIQWVPERAQCSWEKYVTGGWKEAEEERVGAPCCRIWDLLTQLQLYWETVPLPWHSWREMMSCSCRAIVRQAKRALAGLMHPLQRPHFFTWADQTSEKCPKP